MHLVGFIIRIFYDARSSECQKTPDDGQRNCPKHVEFYSKNKFEKLVQLVSFIIRIYHDARSFECQKTPDDRQKTCPKHVEFYSKNKFEKLVHLVGFIIRNVVTVSLHLCHGGRISSHFYLKKIYYFSLTL